MPRTKHLKKPKNSLVEMDECQSLIRDFQEQANVRIQKFEADSKMEIKALDTYIKMIISSMPAEFLELTLNDILIMETCDKENSDSTNMNNEILPPATLSTTTHKLRKTVSDDGYDTERGTSKTRIISTGAAKRTRSKSRTRESKISDLQLLDTKKNTRSVVVSQRFTPSKTKMPNIITPKVNPNSPMNILRRPRQGEMVLSLQGSPLLVSSVVQGETATINVPLQDGRVMSFVPKDKQHLSNIPILDPETMRQLSTLKGYIEQVFGSK